MMKWLGGLWRLFQKELLVLAAALMNRRTPGHIKMMLIMTLLYLISPFDLVPDAVPLAGIVDDAVIVPAILAAVLNRLPSAVRSESEAWASRLGRHMPIILGLVTAVLLLWLGVLVWGVYSFVMWLAH